MPIIYDIVYPKEGQLTLLCNGGIIANSKNISYLNNRMRVNQDELIDANIMQKNTYQIIDMFRNNSIIETHTYDIGERGNGKARLTQGVEINFIEIDPIRPVHSTTYAIANKDGTIITDIDLLGKLYDFRHNNNFPCFIKNKTLAYFATYYPTTHEEFVASFGVSEKIYAKCGKEFLDFINNYLFEIQ